MFPEQRPPKPKEQNSMNNLHYKKPRVPALSLVAPLTLFAVAASGQTTGKNVEWRYYTADVKGSKYSPADQIDASNFGTVHANRN